MFTLFTKDILGLAGFKDMVQKHASSNEKIKSLQSIILKYTDGYIAGKVRFRLDSEELDFILSYLRSTRQYNF